MKKGIVWLFLAALLALPAAAQVTSFAAASPCSATGAGYVLQNAAATTGSGQVLDFRGAAQSFVVTVTWSTGTSAGAGQLEASDDPAYAGTWAPLGPSLAWSAASRQDVIQVIGPARAIRFRITSAPTGGTITARACGYGR